LKIEENLQVDGGNGGYLGHEGYKKYKIYFVSSIVLFL
jgi:hypothetical protein